MSEKHQSERPRLIITIDGPAGSGKSTTARKVALALGYLYLDTGAMYRAFTLAVNRRGLTPDQAEEIVAMIDEIEIDLQQDGERNRVSLNGEEVSEAIRSPEVDRDVVWVCQIPAVRERLAAWQRSLADAGGVVAEGRDQGTVVFPDATLKFYLTASLEARGQRRWQELNKRGVGKDLQSVTAEIQRRDQTDASRELSPLVRPDGAFEIDTSDLTEQEQVEIVLEQVRRVLRNRTGRPRND